MRLSLFLESQLFELRGDDELAVGDRLVVAVVVLVVFLRLVELLKRAHLGDDGRAENPGLVLLFDRSLGDLFLLLRVVEDG